MIQDKVLTTKEATKYLKTTKQTLLKMVHERRIKANRIGKGYRFLQEELDKYLRGENEKVEVAIK